MNTLVGIPDKAIRAARIRGMAWRLSTVNKGGRLVYRVPGDRNAGNGQRVLKWAAEAWFLLQVGGGR